MPLTTSELAEITSWNPRLASLLKKVVDHINVWQRQTGSAPAGQLPAPSTIGGLQVAAGNGYVDVAILDSNAVNPGTHYFLEWDTSPNFSNARVIDLGCARNLPQPLFLGNQTIYLRAYSSYPGSVTSQVVTYGKPPTAVVAGGAVIPPTLAPAQGSGTSQIPGFGFGTPHNRIAGLPTTLK